MGWNTPTQPPQEAVEDQPGDAVREARIRNINYSARERGVPSEDRERNWFNGNGLAQEAPPSQDEAKKD